MEIVLICKTLLSTPTLFGISRTANQQDDLNNITLSQTTKTQTTTTETRYNTTIPAGNIRLAAVEQMFDSTANVHKKTKKRNQEEDTNRRKKVICGKYKRNGDDLAF